MDDGFAGPADGLLGHSYGRRSLRSSGLGLGHPGPPDAVSDLARNADNADDILSLTLERGFRY